ncbi:MAG: lytic transglycosylase domain-containing protein [Proteobacteria bacterium]|nr:lytic transglycosylase domain-containing protein [Pseudomonadota bacterium]
MPVPFLACMAFVASVNHLPPRVLPSIQAVEGGAVGTVHRNTDGSDDLGVMQINTRWLPALATYFGMSQEAVRANLIHAPCFNIAAAGAVLRYYLNEAKGDLMLAIGYYHSHTMPLNLDYRARVVRSAAALFGSGQDAQAPRHGAITRSQE